MSAFIGSGKVADGLVFTNSQNLFSESVFVASRMNKTLITSVVGADIAITVQAFVGGVWVTISEANLIASANGSTSLKIDFEAGQIRLSCVSEASSLLNAWINSEPITA
jgi:hypothetical protein